MDENKLNAKEDEIDLIELLKKIWNSRKTILKISVLFFVFGVFIALFSSKEYTATTIMIPQTSDAKGAGGSLGGLAAMAGISLGSTSSEGVPMTAYPKIVQSIPFKKKLVQTPLKFESIDKEVTYEEYYKSYATPSFLDKVKKYTIGLPGVLFGKSKEEGAVSGDSQTVLTLSKEERVLLNGVDGQMVIDMNEKEGVITLSYSMPEALVAAQMLQSAQTLLQNSITEFKIQKATEEFEFVRERYEEAEKDFKSKQFALAQFQDQNRNLFGSLPQTRLQQLQTDYNLAFSVYSELAKQLETKRIKIKEDQPVFTIIEPVSVPNERSKPKRAMIVAIWTFLGLVVGISTVFLKDFVKQLKEKSNESIS